MSNENKTEWDVVSGGRVACPYCDEDISINAKICKHCKSVLNTTSNDYGKKDVIEKSVLRTKAEWNSSIKIKSESKETVNSCSGCLGIILCFTGIGALIGVPLIIRSMFASNKVKGAWQGKCPKCESQILWYESQKTTQQGEFQCPTCQAKIDFYAGEFLHKTL